MTCHLPHQRFRSPRNNTSLIDSAQTMIVNTPAELAGTAAFDVCIVGTGPADMTIARALPSSLRIALIEAGGFEYDAEEQKNYEGEASGLRPGYLSTSRARMLGGSSNCW